MTLCPLCRKLIRFKKGTRITGGVVHTSCARKGMKRNERGGWTRLGAVAS